MKKWIFALAFLSAPLAAQDQDLGQPAPEGGQVETTGTADSGEDAEGGLVFTVTDESDWADLSIAIPGFAADRDVATPANSRGTAALGVEIANVITANLQNNGLFQPIGPARLPQLSLSRRRSHRVGRPNFGRMKTMRKFTLIAAASALAIGGAGIAVAQQYHLGGGNHGLQAGAAQAIYGQRRGFYRQAALQSSDPTHVHVAPVAMGH